MASNRYVLTGVNIARLSFNSFLCLGLLKVVLSHLWPLWDQRKSLQELLNMFLLSRVSTVSYHSHPVRQMNPVTLRIAKLVFYSDELSSWGFSTTFGSQASTKVSFDPQMCWGPMTFWHCRDVGSHCVNFIAEKEGETWFCVSLSSWSFCLNLPRIKYLGRKTI